jgi:predicted RNase H-like nuclease (RuvC/YqgF family)
MQPSQIFDILVPGHEYDALQEDNNRLSKQNQQCFTEIEELKAQIKKFTEKAENTWEQPQQITHLSRTVLLLGRKALTLQKNCEQLKEESRGRQQVKEMEELMAKK